MTNQPEEAAQTPQHIRSVIITGHEYKVIPSEMAYHHSRSSIRQIYEEHFLGDEREVTVQRVVNVVNGGHGQEYDPGYAHEYWRGGPQNYQDAREYYDEGYYPPPDRRYLDDNPGYQRNSPPPRHDYYHQPGLGRHDLRHQLDSRNHSRPRPHHHYQARGRSSGSHQRSGPERKPHPGSLPATGKRGRSPSSRDQPPVNSSSRSFSPGKDQGPAHHQSSKKLKPNVAPSQTPGSSSSRSSVEESTHSSASSKNQLPEPATSPLNPEPLACQERSAASVAETSVKTVVEVEEEAAGAEEQGRREEEEEEEDDDEEEDEEEEVGAAGTEPKVSTEERVRARRADTIKAKALEITKLYTQDCETFRTVVKMLVAKEPRLDELLQASLDKNLLEIQEHCLDDLRQFVKELDQIIAQGRQVSNSDTLNPAWLARVVEVGEEGEDLPQISFKLEDSSPSRSAGDKSEKEKPGGGTEEPERGKVATPLPENGSFSTPAPSESPSFPAPSKRVQLYGAHGVKLKNNQLFNPKLWHSISCFRPGWVPDRLPFLHGDRYWELKASSTVVSTSPPPPYSKRPKGSKVPCGVTCYIHAEGPWCEIQAANGTRICILVAEPQNRRV